MYVTAKSWGQKNTATRAPGLEASIVPVVAPFNIGGTPGGAPYLIEGRLPPAKVVCT
jgi:hypothetical protein